MTGQDKKKVTETFHPCRREKKFIITLRLIGQELKCGDEFI
jgi:hypothetical protein